MSLKLRNQLITESISKLYLDDGSADVKFVFESDGITTTIPAHKAILASSSPVFYAMFYGSLKEGNSVKITDENLILVYDLARSLGNDDLKRTCKAKIKRSHRMFDSETFHNIDQQTLKRVLILDELVCSEIDIFEGCMAWAKSSCKQNGLDETNSKNLREQLGECFHLIRFGAMSYKLDTIIKNDLYAGLFAPDEILDLMRIVTCEGFKSNKFNQTPRQSISPLIKKRRLSERSSSVDTEDSFTSESEIRLSLSETGSIVDRLRARFRPQIRSNNN